MTESSVETPLVFPALGALYDRLGDLGDLLFRLLVGLIFVPHGYAKLFTSTEGFVRFFGGIGLDPAPFFVYFVGALEFFGGLAVAVGLLTRPLAVALFVEMAVAVFLVHLPSGWLLPEGAEFAATLAVISLVLAVRGGGKYSLDRMLLGREI